MRPVKAGPHVSSQRLHSCWSTTAGAGGMHVQLPGAVTAHAGPEAAHTASGSRPGSGGPSPHRSTVSRRTVFELIDSDGNESISRLELFSAVQRFPKVAGFLLPGLDGGKVMADEKVFDAVSALFDALARGKKQVEYVDFEAYFRRATLVAQMPSPCRSQPQRDRTRTRVLIIGPGFGREHHPQQGAMLVSAGFRVRWCLNLPSPDYVNFNVAPFLGRIQADIDDFRPDVVVCASQGGAYATALWQVRYWEGPVVMVNAHPSLPAKLPARVPFVLAHGSNDEVYRRSRAELEELVNDGAQNCRLLYYTGNSGALSPGGSLTRLGDGHVMKSLLGYDCLPRLIDAVLSPEGPEVRLLQSWRDRLSEERRDAEQWLGHTTERLRRLWVSSSKLGPQGSNQQRLFEVPRTSEEFRRVAAVFKAAPREEPAYVLSPQEAWERVAIIRIERVENWQQDEYSYRPYRDLVKRSLRHQGVEFEPGTHTCWAFHGADVGALESIVQDPVTGFQPLASGARNASVWGSGTYFARDAKYVADGQFCPPRADGLQCMLLCLLTLGMPCLGDAVQKGVLPWRQKPHRYNSAVDSLSSPEVLVVQHPGAAYPAYMVTFV